MKFSELVKYLKRLDSTNSRLEIREILEELLAILFEKKNEEDIYIVAYFLVGKLVPDFIPLEFGISTKMLGAAVKDVLKLDDTSLKQFISEYGDLGEVWANIYNKVNGNVDLELSRLYENLLDLALISGKGANKLKLLKFTDLLTTLPPQQGKYLIRFISGKLRLGLNVRSILDALSYLVSQKIGDELGVPEKIKARLEYLYGITSDIGFITAFVLENLNNLSSAIEKITTTPGIPIAAALAEREKDLKTILKRIPAPALEPKYDGLRGQIHGFKFNSNLNTRFSLEKRVWYKAYFKVIKQEESQISLLNNDKGKLAEFLIFSRNANNLTNMFPEARADIENIIKFLDHSGENFINSIIRNLTKNIEDFNLFFINTTDDPKKLQKEFTQTTLLETKEQVQEDILRYMNKLNSFKFYPGIILDSEIIGFDENTGEFIPFQQTISRRRKYNINDMVSQIPVHFYVFDTMFLGYDLIELPFFARRMLLEQLFNELGSKLNVLRLTPQHVINHKDLDKLQDLFNYYIEAGLEGIMLKERLAPYRPGMRTYSWIKFKRAMKGELADTLDVVVLGYYYGKGKRASLGIGALLLGVYDKQQNRFVTLSKLGTGLTDDKWLEVKHLLDKYKLNKKPVNVDVNKELLPDIWVEPKVVITVEADEITISPVHTAGYALRFPRFKLIRQDKEAIDATTLAEIEEMYNLSKIKNATR